MYRCHPVQVYRFESVPRRGRQQAEFEVRRLQKDGISGHFLSIKGNGDLPDLTPLMAHARLKTGSVLGELR
jgi:hypothetical protein